MNLAKPPPGPPPESAKPMLARLSRTGFRHGRPTDDDSGSTLLLAIFYGFLALAVILMVVAATSLYLERKRLFTVADSAALAGAEAFRLDDVPSTGPTLHLALDSADVHAAVTRFLDSSPHASFQDLTLERADSLDGSSATVELAAAWRPPVLSILVPEGIRLHVTAVARSVVW